MIQNETKSPEILKAERQVEQAKARLAEARRKESAEYSCAMKSHFRKSVNQMSGKWKSSYVSLLA